MKSHYRKCHVWPSSPTSGVSGNGCYRVLQSLESRLAALSLLSSRDPATALNPRMIVKDQLMDPLLVHKVGTGERE